MNEKIANVPVNLAEANGAQYLILADGKVMVSFESLAGVVDPEGYRALEAWATATFAASDAALEQFREMRGEPAVKATAEST